MPECFSVAVDRDAGGKILRREEHWPEGVRCFRYAYDASGHLLRVHCDGREQEAYAYNGAGQRVEDVARDGSHTVLDIVSIVRGEGAADSLYRFDAKKYEQNGYYIARP